MQGMTLPGEKNKGDDLYAVEVNQIVRAVMVALSTKGGHRFNTQVGPGGIIITESPYMDSGIPAQWAWAKNVGEEVLEPYRPAGIVDQIFKAPNDTNSQIETEVVLTIINPLESTGNFEGNFVVCTQQITPGEIGRVWISGICPVWGLSTEELDDDGNAIEKTYAELLAQEDDDGNPDLDNDYLTCATGGSTRLIWRKVDSDDEQLVMVRLGFASVLVTPAEIIPVKMGTKVNYNTYIGAEYGDGTDVAPTKVDVTIRVLQIGAGETLPSSVELPGWLQKWGGVLYRTVDVSRDY